MRPLHISDAERQALRCDAVNHPHPRVRQRCLAILLLDLNHRQEEVAQTLRITVRTVRNYRHLFETDPQQLRAINWEGSTPRTADFHDQLDKEFTANPARSVAEAAQRIKDLTGLELKPSATRQLLKSLGLRWRRLTSTPIPPNMTLEQQVARQQEFLDTKLQPLLDQAERGKGHVFFADAAHFVLGVFLCCLWCKARLSVKASAGRQRFNVLGALNAVTKEVVTVCNTTVVNQTTFCELLDKIAALNLIGPITVVLDNARYQHCRACIAHAAKLNIDLLFLTSYSPNLNLIERLWKFIKRECLYGVYFPNFADFQSRIQTCLAELPTKHQVALRSLLTLNFQSFANRKILSA